MQVSKLPQSSEINIWNPMSPEEKNALIAGQPSIAELQAQVVYFINCITTLALEVLKKYVTALKVKHCHKECQKEELSPLLLATHS